MHVHEKFDVQRNLKDLSLEELFAVADRVKTPTIAILPLFVTSQDSHEGEIFPMISIDKH